MASSRLDTSARGDVKRSVVALRVILAGIFLYSGLIKGSIESGRIHVSGRNVNGASAIANCALLVLGWALANGIIVSCSCFGEDDHPSAMKMALALARDLFLAGLALVIILEKRSASRSGVRRVGNLSPF
jgi:hypothetical protein